MCKCIGAKFQIVPPFPSLIGQVSADSPRITREGQTDKQTIRRGPNRLRATDDAAPLPTEITAYAHTGNKLLAETAVSVDQASCFAIFSSQAASTECSRWLGHQCKPCRIWQHSY